MKSFAFLLFGCVLNGVAARADINAPNVLEYGPHHRVVVNANGTKYTELRNGMHYFDNGQWKATEEVFVPGEDGPIAEKGFYKAKLKQNLITQGAIQITTPDNNILKLSVLGLRYYDAASGQIASREPLHSKGEL